MVNLYKFLTKKGLMIALVVGVVFLALHFIGVAGELEAFNLIPDEPNTKPERLKAGALMVSMGINLTVVLFVIAVIVLVFFSILQVASNPKGAVKGIAGLIAIFIIFFIGYSMSVGEINPVWDEKGFGITETISKYVSGSVFASVALVGLAVVALVGSEIRNTFK